MSTSTLLSSTQLSSTQLSSTQLMAKPLPDYLSDAKLFQKNFMDWFLLKYDTLEKIRDYIKTQDNLPDEFVPNLTRTSGGTTVPIAVKGMYFNVVDNNWQRVQQLGSDYVLHLEWQNIRTPNPIPGQLGLLQGDLHSCCYTNKYRDSPKELVGIEISPVHIITPTTNINLGRRDIANGCEFEQYIKSGKSANRAYSINPPTDTTSPLNQVYEDSRDFIQIGIWENKWVRWMRQGGECYCDTCDYRSGWRLDLKTKGDQSGSILKQSALEIGSDLNDKTGSGWWSLSPVIGLIKPSILKDYVNDRELNYYTCNLSIYTDNGMEPVLVEAFSNRYFDMRQETPTCDIFMTTYCTANKDDIACGCYNPLPSYDCSNVDITKDQNCLAKLIYENQPSNTDVGIEVCIMPKCRDRVAYRFEPHRNLTKDRNMCPSQCNNIINLMAERYSDINVSNVNQVMNCSYQYETKPIVPIQTTISNSNSSSRPPASSSQSGSGDTEGSSNSDAEGADQQGNNKTASTGLTTSEIAIIASVIGGVILLFVVLFFALKK